MPSTHPRSNEDWNQVHAINETARAFYQRYGFLTLNDDPHHRFLPMNVIRKLDLPQL